MATMLAKVSPYEVARRSLAAEDRHLHAALRACRSTQPAIQLKANLLFTSTRPRSMDSSGDGSINKEAIDPSPKA